MAFRLIKEKNPTNEDVKVPFIITMLGSGFFIGFIPFASGTFGSLLGAGIYLIPRISEFYYLILVLVLVFFIGVFCSEKMQASFWRRPAAGNNR